MQEKHLYEYAVIRLVPCVEREEFLNIGIILYCSSQRFLQTCFSINPERLKAFDLHTDIKQLQERLHAFQKICAGAKEGGPIGQLPIASRFRWLTASRSTVIQISPVHPGLCKDAAETLQKLSEQLVQ